GGSMSPISTRRIAALVVVGMAMLLVPAAGASAAPFTVNPNPVNFNAAPGDTSLRNVIVTNNGTRTVDIRRFILSGSAAGFHVVGDLCPHVPPGGRCGFRVTYTASSNPAA